MRIMAFYIGFVVIGELGAFSIGRTMEHWSKAASLPVFLTCFFLVLGLSWRLAVRMTTPKTA